MYILSIGYLSCFILSLNVLKFREFEFQFKLKIRNLQLIEKWPRKKEF